MITLQNFSYSYKKERPIYQDLDLELPPGKVYGLFGKNGEGKSTLLKNMVGLLYPTKGVIKVGNAIPKERKPSFLADVFMIPEEVYIPSISPMSFVRTYGALYPKFSFDHFCEYQDKLDVPETKNLKNLSFGQQKKFYIAFALACNTSVVLMDEPTNGLDIPSKSQFRKLIAATMRDDKIYIISTHQVRDLDMLLDHILIVNRGELLLNSSVGVITEQLAFNFYPQRQEHATVIWQEEVVGGYAVVEQNMQETETPLNLEQLFNTSVMAPDKLKEALLSSKTTVL